MFKEFIIIYLFSKVTAGLGKVVRRLTSPQQVSSCAILTCPKF